MREDVSKDIRLFIVGFFIFAGLLLALTWVKYTDKPETISYSFSDVLVESKLEETVTDSGSLLNINGILMRIGTFSKLHYYVTLNDGGSQKISKTIYDTVSIGDKMTKVIGYGIDGDITSLTYILNNNTK